MPVRAYVGVTDRDWYEFLAARPEIDEVNFWRPAGARQFRALQPGEPFFLQDPLPGKPGCWWGLFSGFAPLHVSEAWQFFDQANGAVDLGSNAQTGRSISQRGASAQRRSDDRLCVRQRRPILPAGQRRQRSPRIRSEHCSGKELRPGEPLGVRLFRGVAHATPRLGRRGNGRALAAGRAHYSRSRALLGGGWVSGPFRLSSSTPTSDDALSPGQDSAGTPRCTHPTCIRRWRASN